MPPFQSQNTQPPIYADQQIEPPQVAQSSLLDRLIILALTAAFWIITLARLVTPVITVALYAAALAVIAVSLAG